MVVRYQPVHLEQLELQPAQQYLRAHLDPQRAASYASGGLSYSVFAGDRLLCCGGVREIDTYRGVLWSFLSRHAGRHFTALHRCALRFVETLDYVHLQATCRTDFEAGARWLELLGFTWSRPLGPYGPARVPHDLFERVR